MNKKKGFTLIEVIITMAIIGIIIIPIFTIASAGLKNIISSGKKTKNVIILQNQLNEEIKGYNNLGSDIITINIPEVVNNYEISGKMLEVPSEDVTFKTFVPNKIMDTE